MESDPFTQLVILNSFNITFYSFNIAAFAGLILTLILLFCSALISGSEIAFFSLSPSEIKVFRESHSSRSKIAVKLLEKPKELLATILVSNNFINIAIVILSTYVINSVVDFSQSPVLGFIVQVVVITFFLLLIGEVIPKIYANQFSSRFAHFMAYPLLVLSRIFSPLSYLLVTTTRVIDKRFQKKTNISMHELSNALELTSESISEDKEILKGIIEFGTIEASEIMCPRVDVMAIELNMEFSRVVREIVEAGYSRIPVYNKTFDNITGILYIKDLIPHINQDDSFKWQSLIRPPYFVPENKKINELLEELQANKIHMAVVVDEYGGTSGIVTMEDILEEIIGDFSDEFDEDKFSYTKINENNYLFEGKTLLNDFCKVMEVDNDVFDQVRGEADTLAGLILEIKGEFPVLYDKIKFNDFTFTIEEIDRRRIIKIKTTIKR